MSAPEYPFPRIPYDEVPSSFVRERIRTGQFADPEYRSYVNYLVYASWYATEGVSENATGLSRLGAAYANWRIAAKYPAAYDAVCRDCGTPTRAEHTLTSGVEEDSDERRHWAERHREEWQAVRDGRSPDSDSPVADRAVDDRPSFDAFRFPEYSYDEVDTEFVRAEIRRGSFDDLEHRRYVNRLVKIEAWVREDYQLVKAAAPPVRPWEVIAKHPHAYDRLCEAYGEPTRIDLVPFSASAPSDLVERARRRRKHAREWRRVQERGDGDYRPRLGGDPDDGPTTDTDTDSDVDRSGGVPS